MMLQDDKKRVSYIGSIFFFEMVAIFYYLHLHNSVDVMGGIY